MKIVEKISDGIWKIKADSNIYLINREKPFVIDTGRRENKNILNSYLSKIVSPETVRKVILTHLHYDHIGNFDFFPNATYYTSADEIEDYRKNPLGSVLNFYTKEIFKVKLNPIEDFDGFMIIPSPGHTRGSISIWYPEEKILFSGDTLFFDDAHGRVDLPTSSPEDLPRTIKTLKGLNFNTLCPGHEY